MSSSLEAGKGGENLAEGLATQIELDADHRAARVDEDIGLTDRGMLYTSVLMLSSAVSLRALSTSRRSSTRPVPPRRNALETRKSSSVCDESRWVPRGSISTRRNASSGLTSRLRPGLATEMLQVGRNHEAGTWHVD